MLGGSADRDQAGLASARGPRCVPPARRGRTADVRLPQRRGAGRRPRARAALLVPHDLLGRDRAGACPSASSGMVPGLGRHLPAAPPVGADTAVTVIDREPAQPEPDAARQAGVRARASPTRCSPRPTSSSGRCAGRPTWSSGALVPGTAPRSTPGPRGTRRSRRGRAIVAARTRGAAVAPARALDLIDLARAPRPATTGFAAEDEVGAELLIGDQLRAGLYAFDLVRHGREATDGAPDRDAGPRGQRRSGSSARA